jgi:hypothetical protein
MVLLDFREKGKVRGTMIGGAIVGRVLGFFGMVQTRNFHLESFKAQGINE